jgi:hypothetical protein
MSSAATSVPWLPHSSGTATTISARTASRAARRRSDVNLARTPLKTVPNAMYGTDSATAPSPIRNALCVTCQISHIIARAYSRSPSTDCTCATHSHRTVPDRSSCTYPSFPARPRDAMHGILPLPAARPEETRRRVRQQSPSSDRSFAASLKQREGPHAAGPFARVPPSASVARASGLMLQRPDANSTGLPSSSDRTDPDLSARKADSMRRARGGFTSDAISS